MSSVPPVQLGSAQVYSKRTLEISSASLVVPAQGQKPAAAPTETWTGPLGLEGADPGVLSTALKSFAQGRAAALRQAGQTVGPEMVISELSKTGGIVESESGQQAIALPAKLLKRLQPGAEIGQVEHGGVMAQRSVETHFQDLGVKTTSLWLQGQQKQGLLTALGALQGLEFLMNPAVGQAVGESSKHFLEQGQSDPNAELLSSRERFRDGAELAAKIKELVPDANFDQVTRRMEAYQAGQDWVLSRFGLDKQDRPHTFLTTENDFSSPIFMAPKDGKPVIGVHLPHLLEPAISEVGFDETLPVSGHLPDDHYWASAAVEETLHCLQYKGVPGAVALPQGEVLKPGSCKMVDYQMQPHEYQAMDFKAQYLESLGEKDNVYRRAHQFLTEQKAPQPSLHLDGEYGRMVDRFSVGA